MLSELDAPLSDVANKSGADREGELVAIVTGKALDAADSLPNGSVNVAEMLYVPSVSVGRVQFVAEPITYVHDTVVVPLVAEIVIVSPLVPPLALKVGVVSLVLLSESDDPVSDAANRSTPEGAVGRDVSTVTDNVLDAADAPAVGCVSVALIDHVPSDNVPRSQPVAGMTYEHVTFVAPDLDAVTVMVFPAVYVPGISMRGVLSLVLLSVGDAPRSDESVRSGV